jgi:hypothetical protein
MKSKSSIPCTALVCMPLLRVLVLLLLSSCRFQGFNSLDETSRLWVEESVVGLWAQRSAGSSKALDVVVCGELVIVSIDTIGAVGGCGGHDVLSLCREVWEKNELKARGCQQCALSMCC